MSAKVVAVFGSSRIGSADPLFAEGVRLGHLLAEVGFTVATGGYAGLMEAVSKGARQGGGEVIGVTAPPVFPGRSGVNSHVTREIPCPTLTERIHILTDIADGFVAMPGSIGTFTELMVAWNVAFVAQFSQIEPCPIATVGEAWAELVPRLAEQLDTDASYVTCVATIDDAARHMVSSLT
jgi:uncharacterized protein (TIGR00730 family)